MLKFSHESRVYVFRGKELNQPAPGSYDAAKWTPPAHQLFRVEIQGDGVWQIMLNGAQIACGEYATRPSRGLAQELIMTHCKTFL